MFFLKWGCLLTEHFALLPQSESPHSQSLQGREGLSMMPIVGQEQQRGDPGA